MKKTDILLLSLVCIMLCTTTNAMTPKKVINVEERVLLEKQGFYVEDKKNEFEYVSDKFYEKNNKDCNVKTKETKNVNENTQTSIEKEVLTLVNKIREENGLQPYQWDNELFECATIRAKELEDNFSHTRPNGEEWYTVDVNVMYGENLAKGYNDAETVVNAWMNSPTHKENILALDLQTCGIALYITEENVYFWAQEFGY